MFPPVPTLSSCWKWSFFSYFFFWTVRSALPTGHYCHKRNIFHASFPNLVVNVTSAQHLSIFRIRYFCSLAISSCAPYNPGNIYPFLAKNMWDSNPRPARWVSCTEFMKETPRRRITVTSSLKEIYSNQRSGGVTPPAPTHFYSRLLDRYLKTTWSVFPPFRTFSSCLRSFWTTKYKSGLQLHLSPLPGGGSLQ
jgi:hypothetical protein